jgi:predicted amidohydrolase
MSLTTIRVAMAQMLVRGGHPDDNLARAERLIEQAASDGCQFVILPECVDVGWTHPSARQLADHVPGSVSDRLARAARSCGIHVVAGLTERSDGRIYNTAILLDRMGDLLLKHRKINILDIAQDLYATGDCLGVAETEFGTVGINICADNFPDSLCLGHSLARMGAQTILSPCAWAVPGDHDPRKVPYGGLWIDAYTTLAELYEIPVVGVSNVGPITGGPWKGRRCIGCSLAIDRRGHILAQLPYGETAETLSVIELELGTRTVTGTEIAPMLRTKGYRGP